MPSDVKRTEGEPHDTLTHLCAVMTDALEDHPAHHEKIQAIIFLTDGKLNGIQIHNYKDDTEAMADLIIHLKAIFEANGKQFLIVPLRKG